VPIDSNFLAHHSLYIENVLRHAFLFELSRELLLRDEPKMVTVLNAEVDDAGVDVVLNVGSVTRYVQMKTLNKRDAPNPYNISENVFKISGGCVLWLCYDMNSLTLNRSHLLGGRGNSLVDVPNPFPVGKKRKGSEIVDRKGYVLVKSSHANHRDLSLAKLSDLLFDL
jgi:hypothetical protein